MKLPILEVLRAGARRVYEIDRRTALAISLGTVLAVLPACSKRKQIESILSPGSPALKLTAQMDQAAVVFDEIMSSGDKSIPMDVLRRAQCVMIMPGLKSYSFVVGARWGSGFLSCRGPKGGGWTAPGAVTLKGGSFGLQVGGLETNLLLFFMNRDAEDKLLSNQITLGVDASAAAGPVGRTVGAQTDIAMEAEVLSWSQSSGLFAGISLQGAALREDTDTLRVLYGKAITNRQVVRGRTRIPQSAKLLVSVLTKYSPRAGASSAAVEPGRRLP